MKVATFNHPETGIAVIVTPAYNDGARDPDSSDADLLARAIADNVPTGTPYLVLEHSEIPADRRARDRWKVDHEKKTVG